MVPFLYSFQFNVFSIAQNHKFPQIPFLSIICQFIYIYFFTKTNFCIDLARQAQLPPPIPLQCACLCVCVCLTLPPRSVCGRRPKCQQHGRSPHTPPLGQEGSPEGSPARSGSHWDPPRRSGPQRGHPDRFLQEGGWRTSFTFRSILSAAVLVLHYSSTQVTVYEGSR